MTQEEILDILEDGKTYTARELSEKLGCGMCSINSCLRRLYKQKHVCKIVSDKKIIAYKWRIRND